MTHRTQLLLRTLRPNSLLSSSFSATGWETSTGTQTRHGAGPAHPTRAGWLLLNGHRVRATYPVDPEPTLCKDKVRLIRMLTQYICSASVLSAAGCWSDIRALIKRGVLLVSSNQLLNEGTRVFIHHVPFLCLIFT